MSNKEKYVRLCNSIYDKGILVKEEDILDKVTPEKEWYQSTYYYNQDHYEQFKKTGSIKGIRDVTTNKLWFDFDSENDPSFAQKDAVEIVNRLNKYGIKDKDIEVYFSGNKGFHVNVTLNKELKPKQVTNICSSLGRELDTLDNSLYDSSQILRIPGTKNSKTGLFKIPLTVKQLRKLDVNEIKNLASSLDNISETFEWSPVEMNENLIEDEKKEEPIVQQLDLKEILATRPREWKDYKWALLNAYNVKPDERHESLLRIAATCKGLGYPIEYTKAMCLVFDEKFVSQTGKPPVADLDSNILASIYSSNWNGGQYSYKNDFWLQKYCERIGIKPEDSLLQESTITIDEAFGLFKDYAENIDELTIKTGIPSLDEKLRLTIGMSVSIVASAGTGKCLGENTPVIMADGTTKMVQDIKQGEYVMGDDSTPRKVLNTVTGIEKLYKVKQKNGDDYIVNASHILSLKGSLSSRESYKYGKIFDINVEEYIKQSREFKRYVKGYKVAVDFKEKKQILDPYFLGYWLGNGTSDKTQLTVHSDHFSVFEYIKKFAKLSGINYKEVQNSVNSKSINLSTEKGLINPLLNKLRDLGVYENKHIPHDYLTGSRKQRLELLAGLIDSDGYLGKNNLYEIIQKNKELSKQILYLVRSLGFKATMSEEIKGYKNDKKTFKGLYYRIIFTGENLHEIPIKLEYKKSNPNYQYQRHQDLTEIEIEDIGIGNYYGFELDGNKRFLLGDFTVTHNTTAALKILNTMSKNNEQSLFLSYDMFHALVFQKLVQKHMGVSEDILFDKFKSNDSRFIEKSLEVLKTEYKNVEFCFKSGQTINDIEQTIKETEEKTGKKIRLVVLDYNELVITDVGDMTQSSAFIAQNLRRLANTLNVCIITLVQPSKMSGNPSDEILSYRAIKGSSSIEQASSVILGMWRPGYDPRYPDDDNYITINCLKNRMGGLFTLDLGFSGVNSDIYELTDEQRDHLKTIRDRKNQEKQEDGKWD